MHVKSRPPFILLLASCVELALTMQLDIGAYDHNVHTASGEREREREHGMQGIMKRASL